MRDESSADAPDDRRARLRRSPGATESPRTRRAVLGLTAGALAGVAGCTDLGSGAGDEEPTPGSPTATPTPTDQHTPTDTKPTGTPDDTPDSVDPEDVTLTGSSVQSSALGEHILGGFLDLRTSDGWLVYVALGTENGHTPEGNSRTFQRADGYPERGALRLDVQAADQVRTYREDRRRNYSLVGDADGAWTAFELPAGITPDEATLRWPAQERTLGQLAMSALERLRQEPPSFTLESFVAGEPGTTPGPTPRQSPSPDHGDFPTTTVDYELRVHNDGGPGRFRGFLDHETPKEQFIADYSQGGARLAAGADAGESRTLTGQYTVYHREAQATVAVQAETAGGSATSHVATD
jgi:hypothetical protein